MSEPKIPYRRTNERQQDVKPVEMPAYTAVPAKKNGMNKLLVFLLIAFVIIASVFAYLHNETSNELEQTRAVLAETEATLAETEAALTEMTSLQEATAGSLADTQTTLAATEAALTAKTAELETTAATLTATQAALTETETALTAKTAELETTAATLTATQATLTETEAALTAKTAELETTAETLTATQATLTETEAALAAKTAELETTAATLTATQATLTETEAALTAKTAELETTAAALTATQTALAENEAALAAMSAELNAANEALAAAEAALTEAKAKLAETEAALLAALEAAMGKLYGTPDASGATPAVNVVPGDVITFGHYEQDNVTAEAEPIEWIVLTVEEGRAFVVSKYVLDGHRYHQNLESVTWAESDMRRWLNNEFIAAAFTADELDAIVVTNVLTEAHPDYLIEGYVPCVTQDRVFLLSVQEIMTYMPDVTDREALATAYGDTRVAVSTLCGLPWWWLRSPGENLTRASYISNSAFSKTIGHIKVCDVNNWNDQHLLDGGVRPAMWIDLTLIGQ